MGLWSEMSQLAEPAARLLAILIWLATFVHFSILVTFGLDNVEALLGAILALVLLIGVPVIWLMRRPAQPILRLILQTSLTAAYLVLFIAII